MRRIGILLTIALLALLAFAAPAAAEANDQASDTAHDKISTRDDKEAGDAAHDVSVETTAQSNSGKGMNRKGGPSEHPGNGWKDPGQDQGSPANVADPDCTGNRTQSPQDTNIGACDDPKGAADKPGGRGGFDADRDWNNGCGNDTDFEDDNNGLCRGPAEPPEGEAPEKKPEAPEKKPDAPDKKPDAPDKKPDAPDKNPDAPDKNPDAPDKNPDAPDKKPDAPDKKPDAPDKKPDAPDKKPEAPEKKPPSVARPPSPPTPPEVLPDVQEPLPPRPLQPTVSREGTRPPALQPTPAQRERLAVTGSPLGEFTATGLGFVAIGMVLLRSRQRMRW